MTVIDTSQGIAIWDSATNTLDLGPKRNGFFATQGICSSQIPDRGAFVLNGDRTRILASTIDSDGTSSVCGYDPAARTYTYGTFPFATAANDFVPTPALPGNATGPFVWAKR